MRRIWGSKPMSSMRSASSNTRNWMHAREMRPRSRRSTSRPGVATRRSHPLSSSRNCHHTVRHVGHVGVKPACGRRIGLGLTRKGMYAKSKDGVRVNKRRDCGIVPLCMHCIVCRANQTKQDKNERRKTRQERNKETRQERKKETR